MQNFLEKIENQRMTVLQWFVGFIGILFVRFLFESISSPLPSGIIPSDPFTLVHYGMFFITVAIGLICILGLFTKNYLASSKFILFLFPIIWIAPLIDIFWKGEVSVMSYIYDSSNNLLSDFIKVPLLQNVNGVTHGMSIAYFIILFCVGYYVWKKTNNLVKTCLSVFFSYTFLFLLGILPSLLYVFTHNSSGSELNILGYINTLVTESNIFHNTLHEGATSVSAFRFLQLGFDKLMSQILLLISFLLSLFYFWKLEPLKLKAVIKNSRPERIALYLSFIILGFFMAYSKKLGVIINPIDYLGILCLLISWLGIWLYSVQINDIVDINIDKITNTGRPLVQNLLSFEDVNQISYICLALALLGSFISGFYPFFFALVGLCVTYIYSVPPLRLKKVPMLSSFLMSIACLCACLSGFYFLSFNKSILLFPINVLLAILVIFTLEINFRDMKDIEGDRQEGIKTLPVLFGPKAVAVCFALAFILLPLFLNFYSLFFISIPASILGYKIILKKPFSEKPVFILHFSFIFLAILLWKIVN